MAPAAMAALWPMPLPLMEIGWGAFSAPSPLISKSEYYSSLPWFRSLPATLNWRPVVYCELREIECERSEREYERRKIEHEQLM